MTYEELTILDHQMRPHARRLVAEIRIDRHQADSLATTIYSEIHDATNTNLLQAIKDSSPLSVRQRLLFFEDYQTWDTVIRMTSQCPTQHALPPGIVQRSYVEMQWLIHLYCSFIFAGDGLFEVLKKRGPAGSCVRKCSSFIRENPIRALRNAVAHGNWHLSTLASVKYWAKRGEATNEPLIEFEASYDDLNFYLALTRCTAWTSLLSVAEELGEAQGGIQTV